MEQMTNEKFDLALVHHFDTCPVSIAKAAGVSFLSLGELRGKCF